MFLELFETQWTSTNLSDTTVAQTIDNTTDSRKLVDVLLQQRVIYRIDQKGGKAWAYEFARPLPDDGSHPEVTQRLRGAFHSSDLWFVFKSLKHCWRPWTKGDWDLSEKMLTAWTNFAK